MKVLKLLAFLFERNSLPEAKIVVSSWFAFVTVFAIDWALIEHLGAAFRFAASILTFITAAVSTIWILRRAWRRTFRDDDTSKPLNR